MGRGAAGRGSATATAQHRHVLVVLQHNFVLFVQVQHGNGRQRGGHTARFGNGTGIDRVDQRLHDGVIGRVEVVGQRERTVAVTVVSVVAGRRHDPVVPADVGEVHV